MHAISFFLAAMVLLGGCASGKAPHVASLAPLDQETRGMITSIEITATSGAPGGLRRIYQGWTWRPSPNFLPDIFPPWTTGPAIVEMGEELARMPEVRPSGAIIRPVLAERSGSDTLKAEIAERINASGRYPIVDRGGAAELALVLDGPILAVVPHTSNVHPQLRARGMLRKDATCLADRFWVWAGAAEDFDRLALNDAELLRTRIAEGIARLAAAIADDLLLSDRRRGSLFPEAGGPATTQPLTVDRPDLSRGLASWEARVEGLKPCVPSSEK